MFGAYCLVFNFIVISEYPTNRRKKVAEIFDSGIVKSSVVKDVVTTCSDAVDDDVPV